MFGRKKKFSTSIFVERATELDTFHLFTHMPLTVAVSKVSTTSVMPWKARESGQAIGVLHDSYGHGQPLLPVEIKFQFKANGEEAGWGEVWTDARPDSKGFYRARIIVNDLDAKLFTALKIAAEHAAISGNHYLHLVFNKKRKKPYDAKTDHQETKAERERLDALMRKIDAGDEDAEMPQIAFDTIYLEDAILTKAPAWSRVWAEDVLAPDRVMYHSKDAAKWRGQSWRQGRVASHQGDAAAPPR